MVIGENIRKYRIEQGLTQKKLGELAGIHEANIRKYELGKQNPKIETIEKIAKALNINVIDLLHGDFLKYRVDYHKTAEYKETEKESLGFYATLKLLECIYNRAENINVDAYKNNTLDHCSNYISIGEGKDKIAISNASFDKIVESVKSNLISLIELSGENETQYLADLKNTDDIDSLSLYISERPKILLEDSGGKPIPYLDPF